MVIVGGNGQQDRDQNIVGLLTGKGVAIQYRANDGSWHPMGTSGASAAWYNAGLVLVDYLKLQYKENVGNNQHYSFGMDCRTKYRICIFYS